MSDSPQVDEAVELPARLVYALLKGAVRVAARVHLPLRTLQDLLRTAYFAEYRRRHPRDLSTVAERLGVSLRTAGSLNRQLREPFFAPETRVEPVRQVTAALLCGALSAEQIEGETGLDAGEVTRVLAHLSEIGWVRQRADGRFGIAASLRVHGNEDLDQRLDAVSHQTTVVADSVWARFARDEQAAAVGRSWTFAARPEDVPAVVARVIATLREEATELEDAAMSAGGGARFGLTVAIAPLEDDR